MDKIVKNFDKVSLVEKRISYLIGARLRDKDKMKMAMEKQDKIRENHSVSQGWDSVSTIRKWRESR